MAQIVLDRIELLWETDLECFVISSPEFCEFKLFHYFTDYFWQNRTLSQRLNQMRNACYFNPGVMLFDTVRPPVFSAFCKTRITVGVGLSHLSARSGGCLFSLTANQFF